MSAIPPPPQQPTNKAVAAYEDWSLDKSIAFLKEQGVAIKDSATFPEIQKQVAAHADAAAKWGAGSAGAAQGYFEGVNEKLLSTWTESQLREWLLEQGVVSPSSGREELLVKAKQQ